ncbi:F420-dependent oxidoreductase-like protein [Microbacterium endophyticum]|uniref:F420-dependent oxidoreductase-like protein n=1 Tax=Microbacterium endophyticum TaxID=1526412 RepID=A0A7W4V2Z7_9MICO|nr:LLM class F420-dependent oxidoreductase [Microbacterium endophyticum]MBB2975861.1 F420-dependent oxidoreductase-like protein [Microbacterium endophyticum]NIK36344.1 F420-dependent oxidoreductase-like protein [Microbacterium endophyticum]
MRYGIFTPQGWRFDLVDIDDRDQWSAMRGLAQRADAGAWESLWVYDHFHTVPVASDEATHEAWTLMSAFAASTSRIRLGQMCTCMGYRNPAMLAKVAATVDHVSGGRVEMGIGGGWYEHEWRAYGYGFPAIGDRLAMLREGVEIMSQAWTTGTATLAGKHYQVDGAIVRPLPVQQGGIPMWIAGGGEKVTLKIAAKYAGYTNFAGSMDEFDHKSEVLRGHCAAIGRDDTEIVRSMNFNTIVGSTEAEANDRLAAVKARLLPHVGEERATRIEQDYRASDGFGTTEQVAERLAAREKRGLGYAIHYFPEAAYDVSGMELFERDVM